MVRANIWALGKILDFSFARSAKSDFPAQKAASFAWSANSSPSHFDASEPHIFCHRRSPPGGQLPQRNRTTNPLIIHTLLPTPRTTAISRPPRIPKSSNPQPRLHQRHHRQPTKQRPRHSLLTCLSPAATRDLQRVSAGHRGRQQSEINQNYISEMQQSW